MGKALDSEMRRTWNTMTYGELLQFSEKFAELIVKEHIDLLRQEWYRLNNAPSIAGEGSRDVGIRVGRKSEIISLIENILQHFGVEE